MDEVDEDRVESAATAPPVVPIIPIAPGVDGWGSNIIGTDAITDSPEFQHLWRGRRLPVPVAYRWARRRVARRERRCS